VPRDHAPARVHQAQHRGAERRAASAGGRVGAERAQRLDDGPVARVAVARHEVAHRGAEPRVLEQLEAATHRVAAGTSATAARTA
jgi:hypothetical protein